MSNSTTGSTPHILVVDDDQLTLNLVKLTIQRTGYKVSMASSATAALEYIRKRNINVVVSDIRMPDMTGLELLNHIKEYDSNLPVILLTSSDKIDDAIEALRLGAQDYLIKPSNSSEVHDSIARALIERDRLSKLQPNITISIDVKSLPRWSFTRLTKRLLDIMVSLLALILLSPVIGMTYLAVRVQMGVPVFFSQQRPGLKGKPFTMFKFRSMTNLHTDEEGNDIPDEKRITPLGNFLRISSLDELPELFNVIRGDMSLVGPRPLLIQYLAHYPPHVARRHEVRPGITGWAQVSGRNELTWEEKFALDIWYVDNLSLWVDIKILLLTIKKVLNREGIGHQEQVIMPEYSRQPDEEPDWMAMIDS